MALLTKVITRTMILKRLEKQVGQGHTVTSRRCLIVSSVTAYRSSSHAASESTDSGIEILGRGVRELVQAVQNLRHLGVEDLVLPLPKIVVVGDQSTGKSSLIEVKSPFTFIDLWLYFINTTFRALVALKYLVTLVPVLDAH